LTSGERITRDVVVPAEEQVAGTVLRILLAGVAFAAGLTGLFLFVWPGSTARYFSWELNPAPLASLIGGSYMASLVVFGIAAKRSWPEMRGLVAGTLALTLPMLTVTFFHLDVFDFGRLHAWAWVLLFIASPISFGTVLWIRRGTGAIDDDRLATRYRFVAGLLAAAFLLGAVALWWNPEETARLLPFGLPPFGGRVLGCWSSFLAFLAGWSAGRARVDEVRVPLFGVALFMVGAIGGALRNFGDLQPSGRRAGYVIVLGAVLVMSSFCLVATGRAAPRSEPR
jgi:hypothetical protein